MGYAKHVGRVGALALALGIGVAVGSTPGVAWADGPGDTNVSEDNNGSEDGGNTTNPGSLDAGTPPVERQNPGEAIRKGIERTADRLRTVVAGVVQSSGGAITSTHRAGSSTSGGNVIALPPESVKKELRRAPLPTDENAVASSHLVAPRWRGPQVQSAIKPAPTAATKVVNELKPSVHETFSVVAGTQHTSTESTSGQRNANASLEQPSVAAERDLRTPFVAPIGIVANVLNAAIAPFINSAPGRPAPQNPVLWAVLAFVRRQFQDTPFGKIVLNRTPVLDAEKTSAVVDKGNGEFLITPVASDPDGDDLTYRVTVGENDRGTVTANQDGTFTYKVSDPGSWDKSDVVTVTVSDEADYPHLHGLGLLAPGGGHTDTVQVKIEPTATAEVVELPTGYTAVGNNSVLVGSNGSIYRTTTFKDDSGNDAYALVVRRSGSSTPEIIELPGEPIGELVIGPGGALYQNTRILNSDAPSGYDYAITVIPPAPSASTFARVASTALDTGTNTVALPGEPAGSPAFGSDGTIYQPVRAPGDTGFAGSGCEDCSLAIVLPGDTTAQIVHIPGQLLYAPPPASSSGGGSSLVTAGPGRTAYLTTVDSSVQTITVWRVDADTATAEDIVISGENGINTLGATIGADGTAYKTTRLLTWDGTQFDYDTKLWVIAPNEDTANSFQLDGDVYSPVVVDDDGIAYVTTSRTTSSSIEPTVIWRVDPTGSTAPTPIEVEGLPYYSLMLGPDGTAYQTVFRDLDPDGDPSTPDNTQQFLTVVIPQGSTTPTVVDLGTSTSGAGPVTISPQGTAYQLMTEIDPATYSGDTTVFVFDGATHNEISLDGVATSIDVGPDGKGYVVTVTNVDQQIGSSDETLWVINPTSTQPLEVPIDTVGVPISIQVGGDSAVLTTLRADPGNPTRPLYEVVRVALPSQAV